MIFLLFWILIELKKIIYFWKFVIIYFYFAMRNCRNVFKKINISFNFIKLFKPKRRLKLLLEFKRWKSKIFNLKLKIFEHGIHILNCPFDELCAQDIYSGFIFISFL